MKSSSGILDELSMRKIISETLTFFLGRELQLLVSFKHFVSALGVVERFGTSETCVGGADVKSGVSVSPVWLRSVSFGSVPLTVDEAASVLDVDGSSGVVFVVGIVSLVASVSRGSFVVNDREL